MTRLSKFTPECLEQIKNLVEQGLSREQIAETVGSTVGSLQVTCSKHGISLRTRSKPMMVLSLPPVVKNGNGHTTTIVSLKLESRGRSIETRLNLTEEQVIKLILAASAQNITMAKLINQILLDYLKG